MDLSVQEKVGQKFMFGVNSSNMDIIIRLIREYSIGGVILYKNNYNSYDEMVSVIKKLKEANKHNKIPLFIAIDQEGGRVNRMPAEFHNLKNIYDLSKTDMHLVYRDGFLTGTMLTSAGVNMNFAPVMDLSDENSKALYHRCFYGDCDRVYEGAKQYVQGLIENKVIPVCKHYPGHGATRMDTHFFTPYVFNYKKVLNQHMKPFLRMINDGIDAIMVNHMVIRKLTYGMPASISSRFLHEDLREKNQFDGLIITDELHMLSRGILYHFCYKRKAILSGSDILLVKARNNDFKMIDKYIKMVQKKDSSMKLLDESVSRIIKIKEKYNISDDAVLKEITIDDINREIDSINQLCS